MKNVIAGSENPHYSNQSLKISAKGKGGRGRSDLFGKTPESDPEGEELEKNEGIFGTAISRDETADLRRRWRVIFENKRVRGAKGWKEKVDWRVCRFNVIGSPVQEWSYKRAWVGSGRALS